MYGLLNAGSAEALTKQVWLLTSIVSVVGVQVRA